MRNVLLILLLISLPGCQPGKESPARSTALREVKRMIIKILFLRSISLCMRNHRMTSVLSI